MSNLVLSRSETRRRLFRRRRGLVAGALALALVAAACGSDGGSTADTSTDTGASATTVGGSESSTGGSTATDDTTATTEGDGQTQVSGDAPAEASVDTIHIGVPTLQEQYVDPHFAVGGLLFPLRWAISESLYRQTLDLEWVPNMATSYEISDDGLTWTFQLRDDIKMQDGSMFTARDVKTAVDRILGSDDFAHYAVFRNNVTGANVIDDTTVEITTAAPYATLLSDMPPPIPTDYYNEVGEEGFRAQPMAAGAWKFVSQELNASVTYERFDDFFDKDRMPNFKNLVFDIIPDESARVAGLKTGALDMAFGLTALSADQVDGQNGIRIVESKDTGLAFLFPLDLVAPDEPSPLQDVRVRKALLMAIDRQAIADSLYRGYARVPAGALPPTTLGYDDSLEPYPYDPDQAKALLEEAGASGLSIKLNSYNSTPTVPDVTKLVETVAAYWQQIGVKVEMNVVDTATILPAWRDRQLRGMGLLAGPSQYYDEPARLVSSFFNTDASYSSVSNADLDALGAQINEAVDMDERTALGRELSDVLYEQLYGLPLILVSSLVAVGPNVANFQPMVGSPYAGPLWSLQAA